MLNIVSWDAVVGEYASPFDDSGSGLARCWVFAALCFSFSGLISSIWILCTQPPGDAVVEQQLAGQNGLLFASSLLFRAARTFKADDS